MESRVTVRLVTFLSAIHNCCLYYLIDIDECKSGAHQCTQICTNNNGSYTCSCNNGYELSKDERTCTGEEINIICSQT